MGDMPTCMGACVHCTDGGILGNYCFIDSIICRAVDVQYTAAFAMFDALGRQMRRKAIGVGVPGSLVQHVPREDEGGSVVIMDVTFLANCKPTKQYNI